MPVENVGLIYYVPPWLPAGENTDLGHTANDQSETCKTDPQVRSAPQIQPTQREPHYIVCDFSQSAAYTIRSLHNAHLQQ